MAHPQNGSTNSPGDTGWRLTNTEAQLVWTGKHRRTPNIVVTGTHYFWTVAVAAPAAAAVVVEVAVPFFCTEMIYGSPLDEAELCVAVSAGVEVVVVGAEQNWIFDRFSAVLGMMQEWPCSCQLWSPLHQLQLVQEPLMPLLPSVGRTWTVLGPRFGLRHRMDFVRQQWTREETDLVADSAGYTLLAAHGFVSPLNRTFYIDGGWLPNEEFLPCCSWKCVKIYVINKK